MQRILLFFMLLLAMAALAAARDASARDEAERITVTHTYVMGDSESKNQARIACLNEAKRRIAEQAGAYVEVLSRAKNFQLAEDEVLSFTAALLRVEIDKEEIVMDGGNMALTLTVTGTVRPAEVKARLDALSERRLVAQEGDASLLHQADRPEAGPAMIAGEQAAAPEREAVQPEVTRPAPPRQAADPYAARERLERDVERSTRLVAELCDKGMTRSEVEHLLGQPRAVKYNPGPNYLGYNYGRLWVVFRDDVVACVRKRLEYRPAAGGDTHCEGLAFNFVKR
jgi:hypothetical protein